MKNISILKEKAIYPKKPLDIGLYVKRVFSMFGGEETFVTIVADVSLIGVFIDKFGKDIVIQKFDSTFKTTVIVAVSDTFISWVLQFGTEVKVVEPFETALKIASKIDLLKPHYSDVSIYMI